MIHQASLDALAAAQHTAHFICPRYADYSFTQIAQTVRCCLGASPAQGVPFGPRSDLYAQYDAVVLLFVDAFGWRFFEQYAERAPALRRFVDDGLVCKLSAQFPSTTAAHVTAMHTGLPCGQSGVFEWFYYEPQLDAVIAPLLFSFAGDKVRDTLRATGIDPAQLYPTATLYQELAQHGVDSWVLQHHSYAHSPFTQCVAAGASIVAYHTLPEALVNLAQLLEQRRNRSYYYLYFDAIDTICHRYGPASPQVAAEIELLLAAIERLLLPMLERAGPRTLLLVTADHGQTAIDPATAIYLNREAPALLPLLRTDRAGRALAPAGSSRDMFLYVRDEQLAEAHALLAARLAGRADVALTQDLIAQGFFGPSVSATFLGRVGNLVILPYPGESVWWYEKGRFEQRYYGSHGGLTRDEMETILLVYST